MSPEIILLSTILFFFVLCAIAQLGLKVVIGRLSRDVAENRALLEKLQEVEELHKKNFVKDLGPYLRYIPPEQIMRFTDTISSWVRQANRYEKLVKMVEIGEVDVHKPNFSVEEDHKEALVQLTSRDDLDTYLDLGPEGWHETQA